MFGSDAQRGFAISESDFFQGSSIDVFQDILDRFGVSIRIKHTCNTRFDVGYRNGTAIGIYHRFGSQTLVDVFCCIVKHTQHRGDSIT